MAKRTGTVGGTGTYLYAIVAGTEDLDLGTIGLYNSRVYSISEGDLSAVVSDLPKMDKLRPERRHLAAHQAVLSRITEDSIVVLPVSFGTISDSGDALRKMLSRYHDELVKEIERVRGKVEMEVRVSLDVPNVFEYFVSNQKELKETRDRVFDSKHEPTQDEKIELGQLFEKILNEERDKSTKTVEKSLSHHCVELKRNKCRNENEVMRLSCLVEKDRREEFESAIEEAAKLFGNEFIFEFNGPFPPYNFINAHLRV